MKLRLNANAIITNKDNKVLVVKFKDGPFKDRMCIPGGGVEPGELGAETVIREIKEETGINLYDKPIPFGFCELIKKDIDSQKVVLLFKGFGEGVPVETEESFSFWEDWETLQKEGIPFTREALRIFREGQNYFKIVE